MVHNLYLQNAKRNRNHARNELQLGFCRCEHLVVESEVDCEREQWREEKMERRTANGEMYPRSDDNVECNATTLRSEKNCLAQTWTP